MKKLIVFIIFVSLTLLPLFSLDTAQAKKKGTAIGVVCNMNTETISLIDPATQTIHDPYLKSLLGNGGVIAVAITHDGRTAVISNFGNSQLHFVDLSAKFAGPPVKLGTCNITIFAEDLAITPDDKYVLVTDGAFASRIVVVDIATMTIAGGASCGGGDAQAIAVGPDGQTVMATDYWGGKVHIFKLDPDTGTLMRQYEITEGVYPAWPLNVTISPNGRTAVAITAFRNYILTFRIDGPAAVTLTGTVPTPPVEDGQTAVFSPDGKRLYVRDFIRVGEFKVTGPGMIEPTGRVIWLTQRGTGQFFGVNTMAIDPSGTYLYVTNPEGGRNHIIDVLDVNTFVPSIMEGEPYPAGIDFGWISD